MVKYNVILEQLEDADNEIAKLKDERFRRNQQLQVLKSQKRRAESQGHLFKTNLSFLYIRCERHLDLIIL